MPWCVEIHAVHSPSRLSRGPGVIALPGGRVLSQITPDTPLLRDESLTPEQIWEKEQRMSERELNGLKSAAVSLRPC
jgi:hypothetical protein